MAIMGRAKHRRKRFYTPGKGSRCRLLLLRMMRPEGITVNEAKADKIIVRSSDFSAYIDQLHNTGGWDIRSFVEPKPKGQKFNTNRYRVVGRLRWTEGYRSFISKIL